MTSESTRRAAAEALAEAIRTFSGSQGRADPARHDGAAAVSLDYENRYRFLAELVSCRTGGVRLPPGSAARDARGPARPGDPAVLGCPARGRRAMTSPEKEAAEAESAAETKGDGQ